jgi:hypothetical protein
MARMCLPRVCEGITTQLMTRSAEPKLGMVVVSTGHVAGRHQQDYAKPKALIVTMHFGIFLSKSNYTRDLTFLARALGRIGSNQRGQVTGPDHNQH